MSSSTGAPSMITLFRSKRLKMSARGSIPASSMWGRTISDMGRGYRSAGRRRSEPIGVFGAGFSRTTHSDGAKHSDGLALEAGEDDGDALAGARRALVGEEPGQAGGAGGA